MTLNNPTNVSAAFDMLVEEIEAEIETVNSAGARFFQGGEHDKAQQALEHVQTVVAFRAKVAALRDEWSNAFEMQGSDIDDEETGKARRNLGRLRRGLRTPEAAYYQPILEALKQLGGSAPMNDVLDRVEKAMKGSLKSVDYQPLASDPATTRWRNGAQWARLTLVQQGFMKSDSPRGIWEISEKGSEFVSKASV